jgi:diguanylate cyclase (GGDEF)-like protein
VNAAWGLRSKVLLASAAVAAVLLLAMALLLVHERNSRQEVLRISRESQTQLVTDVARARVLAVATQLAETVTNDLYYFDLQSIGEQLGFTLRQPPIAQALVFDGQRRIVHDGSREISTYGDALDAAVARRALASDAVQIDEGDGAVTAARRIRIGDEILGGVLVRFDMTELNATVATGNRALAGRLEAATEWRLASLSVLLGLVVVLGLLSSWVIQRRIVRPILTLASAARQIEAGQYGSYRLDSGRGDEIGQLERVFEKMSERITEAHRTVERKAYVDKLTGLPNRRAFDDALATRTAPDLALATPFALLFIDLDNLKQINDRFGHDAGDNALIQFARRAGECLDRGGAGSAWLARIGGDEFAVLCEGHPLDQVARRQAQALIDQFNPVDATLAAPLTVGVSIGIALYPDHATSASDLLKCADIAMYRAKSEGKNRIESYRPQPV